MTVASSNGQCYGGPVETSGGYDEDMPCRKAEPEIGRTLRHLIEMQYVIEKTVDELEGRLEVILVKEASGNNSAPSEMQTLLGQELEGAFNKAGQINEKLLSIITRCELQ